MRRLNKLLLRYGFSAQTFRTYWRYLPDYKKDLKNFSEQAAQAGTDKEWPMNKRPILEDKHDESGILKGAYFHQDLLVARKIYLNKPERHIDIGSRTDGFVAHVAVFRPIEIMDIRPLTAKVENISFLQADLMNPIPERLINCCDSISSLHAIEHFGLGRYGDPIDPVGHIKALDNIYQMLKPGGTFYFSVPLGPQRIEFNAHRVFSYQTLLSLFEKKYTITEFSYIDDAGDLHRNVSASNDDIARNFNCTFGCAVFELKKV